MARSSRRKVRRRRHKAAFALDRFDENCRNFFRRQNRLEQFLFYIARATQAECLFLLGSASASAVHVGISHVRDSRHEGAKTPLLLRLRSGQRQCAHGPSVECAEERNDLLASSVVSRHLQRALNRLGAGVSVEKPVRSPHRRHGREPVSQIRQSFVIKVCA